MPTATSGWTPVTTQAATTAMLQPPSNPTHTRGTPTNPAWPWPTTPTLPHPGAPRPTGTATSRTSVGIRGTARARAGGAQRINPWRRLAAPPFPPQRRPPAKGPAPGCVHPQLPPPPPGMGLGASVGPGHSSVGPAPLRPQHVPAPAKATLLPRVHRDGLLAPQHPVAGGRRTLHAGVWVSPDTVLPQRHAPDFPHPARTPPRCPPTVPAQTRLYRGHRPHPGPCLGAGSHISPPSPT